MGKIRQIYDFDADEWVSSEEYHFRRGLKVWEGHHIIPDELPPMESPADGKIYTSRSKLLESYRATNSVELGNERIKRRSPEPDRARKEFIARCVYGDVNTRDYANNHGGAEYDTDG